MKMGEPRPSPRPKTFYASLPKVDLHRHLEGALRLDTLIDVAQTHDLDLPYHDPDALRALVQVLPEDPYTYQNFLSKFATLRKFFLSPAIIQRIVREAIEDAAADNVHYLELRFTPAALGARQGIPPAEVIDLVIEAADAASAQTGLAARLIVSMNRHEPVELAEKVTIAAVGRAHDGIVGLDLAGDEVNFSARPFAPLLRAANEEGLRLTVHAGEWGGAENVVEAITELGAERIGHGIRVLEMPAAVALAREHGTVFEVCPTSNVQTGVVGSLAAHPFGRMLAAGLRVTLNTDDPGISAITLTDECFNVCERLAIPFAQFKAITLESARAAFLDPAETEVLAEKLDQSILWPSR